MKKQTVEKPQLAVIARSPFTVYYEGPANSLTAKNRIGPFDILPGHANFFSVMSPGEIVIDTGTEPVSFTVTSGIITVKDDEVMIFVNI